MIKKNEQAKVHVDSKHGNKKFEECFPRFCGRTECGIPLWSEERNAIFFPDNPPPSCTVVPFLAFYQPSLLQMLFFEHCLGY